jgi:hypothetical protein
VVAERKCSGSASVVCADDSGDGTGLGPRCGAGMVSRDEEDRREFVALWKRHRCQTRELEQAMPTGLGPMDC